MKWQLPDPITTPPELLAAVGGHPLVSQILARRGFTDVAEAQAFLDPAAYQSADITEMPDLDVAAQRLIEGINAGETILVWGDFDVDGQTSTSLLVDALRGLGGVVRYHVPHRMHHGHGVQPDVLATYFDEVDIVLTCDTGIGAHEAIERGKAAGVTMLITDHHALPAELPDAPAMVNPQRLPKGHPLRDLPGVGVAYLLAQHLYDIAGRGGEEERLLDLVALGIVADVATQRKDTRYLLQLGMEALRDPQRLGLQVLMESAQVDPSNMSSDTIGFQIGPRLNALGRLDDASLAVELLTTDNLLHARQIAAQLEVLNNRRKQIEAQIVDAAYAQIQKDPGLVDDYEIVLLTGESWHPGVIGIVASRIVEQYEKPALLMAVPPPGDVARGSARSVPGVNIGASIAAHGDMLIGHGGHPGAAGCALDADLVPQFRRRLSNTIADTWDRDVVVGLSIDAEVNLSDLSMELAEELNRLGPFGAGNPPVRLLTRSLSVVNVRPFGMKKNHRKVSVVDAEGGEEADEFDLTWWRGAEQDYTPSGEVDLVYIPRINDYKGKRSLQLEWLDSRPTPGSKVKPVAGVETVDVRNVDDLTPYLTEDNLAIWAEGLASSDLPQSPAQVISRHSALPISTLLVWTTPPGVSAIQQIMDQTRPDRVVVANRHAPTDTPEVFLKRLGGLVKYAMKSYGGRLSVFQLAAASSQREITVRTGLDWMAATGEITLEWIDGDRAQVVAGGAVDETERAVLQDQIKALISEAAAFRSYFNRTDVGRFFAV